MPVTPQQLYVILSKHFGLQQWWPIDHAYHKKNNSDPRFEIMVGAILTQNTAWTNVEKALYNLKKNQVLSVKKIQDVSIDELKKNIQPSGFFNQKALRLKILSELINETYHNSIDDLFKADISQIRTTLLSVRGIGPETADSIILYAGNMPIFVVDAYTTRLTQRLPFRVTRLSYDSIQQFFQQELKQNYTDNELVFIYKQFHALIVECAKQYCKKKPICNNCPVQKFCKKNLL
jgi:endonuclease III related protein